MSARDKMAQEIANATGYTVSVGHEFARRFCFDRAAHDAALRAPAVGMTVPGLRGWVSLKRGGK